MHSTTTEVIEITIQLRYDHDKTTTKKLTRQFFARVVRVIANHTAVGGVPHMRQIMTHDAAMRQTR